METQYGIIDYGMGNLKSIYNAIKALEKPVQVIKTPDRLADVDAIILPGVGAFADGMKNLTEKGFVPRLEEEVVHGGKPYLGICLGMQFLADLSSEFGQCLGLGWITGAVEKITVSDHSFKIPHMGWNNLSVKTPGVLFNNVDKDPVFYFVHSFYLNAAHEQEVTATCYHGMDIVASVEKDNIFGVQFHPEKSLGAGLQVLNNFCEYAEVCHA